MLILSAQHTACPGLRVAGGPNSYPLLSLPAVPTHALKSRVSSGNWLRAVFFMRQGPRGQELKGQHQQVEIKTKNSSINKI